jgi:lipooligosaccharide transport system permease protein
MFAATITAMVAIVLGALPLSCYFIYFPVMLLGSLLFGAMGMLSAALVTRIDQLNVPVFLITLPMFACCGTYFPRDGLPSYMRVISECLPMAWLCDLMRWHLAVPDYPILKCIGLLASALLLGAIAQRLLDRKIFK